MMLLLNLNSFLLSATLGTVPMITHGDVSKPMAIVRPAVQRGARQVIKTRTAPSDRAKIDSAKCKEISVSGRVVAKKDGKSDSLVALPGVWVIGICGKRPTEEHICSDSSKTGQNGEYRLKIKRIKDDEPERIAASGKPWESQMKITDENIGKRGLQANCDVENLLISYYGYRGVYEEWMKSQR